MKRTIIRIMAAVLAIALMFTTAACTASAENLEQELGVSFENIICQYSYGPGWIQDPLEEFDTNITVYADGRVRIWTDHNGVVLVEEFTTISQEKIDALIKSIRKNNLFALDDCSNHDILDGGWSRFYFFDAEGNKVHDCGGVNCTNTRYCAAESLFIKYFPYNDPLVDSVEEQSYGELAIYLTSIGEGYKLNYSDLCGTVLNIRCFNEEFRGYFERYYTMPEGITVNWIVDPADGGIYYNRLDEALAAQSAGEIRDADKKIDLFIVSGEYLSKYIESDYVIPLDKLGYKLPEPSYQYAIDACTNSKGEQMAVPIYLYPGALIYRRSIARAVLGTDDPAQVQERLDSWEKFEQVAAEAKAKGYYMTASIDDTLYPFVGSANSFSTEAGNDPRLDRGVGRWLTQTETFLQNGYTLPHTFWSNDKMVQMAADGKTMCFFGPMWYYNYCMYPIQENPYSGWASSYGDWAICQGPQSYEWGSTWLLPCKGTDNAAMIWDIFETFSDTEVCENLIRCEYTFPNNTEAVLNIINSEDYSSGILGGQNDYAVLHEVAQNMCWNGLNEYRDYTVVNMPEYILPALTGEKSYDEAMSEFAQQLNTAFPELGSR